MTESPDMRIGDAEREAALTALGEHMSVGRLDVDEYGDRSAKVSTAKTRGELTALFNDLPEPRPRFDQLSPGSPASQPSLRTSEGTDGQLAGRPANQAVLERVFNVLIPLSAVLAVALFFGVTHSWLVFLLPAVITLVGGAVFGDDWRDHHRRGHWRGHRRRY
ncbi:MAG: DUF1707 SHOCT-like domain-containing protein [Sciscionella sp.]